MQINVKLASLKNAAASFEIIEKRLQSDMERLEKIMHTMHTMDNEALQDVLKKLEIQKENINVETHRIQSLKSVLEQVADCYKSAEQGIADYDQRNLVGPFIQFGTGNIPFEPIKPKILDAGIHFK